MKQTHQKELGYYTSIATKICRTDKTKLEIIANGFNMSVYELLQSLLLAIIRYFDKESNISEEHNLMMDAFSNTIFSRKCSFNPIAVKDHEKDHVTKALLFIERGDKSPQLLCVSKDNKGNLLESFNYDTIITDLFNAVEPNLLLVLQRAKYNMGDFSILHTLHEIIYNHACTPKDSIEDEIKQMFEDERLLTGEKTNYNVFYKTKNNKFKDCTTLTPYKKVLRMSLMK